MRNMSLIPDMTNTALADDEMRLCAADRERTTVRVLLWNARDANCITFKSGVRHYYRAYKLFGSGMEKNDERADARRRPLPIQADPHPQDHPFLRG